MVYGVVPAAWGGGPNGVRAQLPYLDRLGITVLWLWPPVARRAWGEEYAITDYTALDPSWGTPHQFRQLVDAAHARGMRVIIDFVPNHTSDRHHWFRAAERRGRAAASWNYYERDRFGAATYYFDWSHLPNLDLDEPAVRAELLAAMRAWARNYDVDGFRMDAAWGPRRRSPDFWRWSTARLRQTDPDLLLLAEAPAAGGWYHRNGFDLAYDWGRSLGVPAWQSAWGHRHVARRLAAALRRTSAEGSGVLRFLDTNDSGRRFVDRYGVATAGVAAVLEFTVPGVPVVFAGQELGASYEPYSLDHPLAWRDSAGLLPLYRRLIQLRHQLPSLRSDRLHVVAVRSDVLVYLRPHQRGDQPALVALNFGPEPAAVSLPGDVIDRVGDSAQDLLTGNDVSLSGGRIQLEPSTGMILVPG